MVRWKGVASGAVKAMLRGVESLIAGKSNTFSRFRERAERLATNNVLLTDFEDPLLPDLFPIY